MIEILKKIVHEYGWIHTSIGLIGNAAFFIGSILFLPHFEAYKTTGIWLFIIGSFLMMIGSVGVFLVNLWKDDR